MYHSPVNDYQPTRFPDIPNKLPAGIIAFIAPLAALITARLSITFWPLLLAGIFVVDMIYIIVWVTKLGHTKLAVKFGIIALLFLGAIVFEVFYFRPALNELRQGAATATAVIEPQPYTTKEIIALCIAVAGIILTLVAPIVYMLKMRKASASRYQSKRLRRKYRIIKYTGLVVAFGGLILLLT